MEAKLMSSLLGLLFSVLALRDGEGRQVRFTGWLHLIFLPLHSPVRQLECEGGATAITPAGYRALYIT